MKRRFIPVEETFKKWKKDMKYVAAYDAPEKEFAIASAMIKARAQGLRYFALAGGTIPFIRRYSTICP